VSVIAITVITAAAAALKKPVMARKGCPAAAVEWPVGLLDSQRLQTSTSDMR
jgi:hypothetical protein